ncbi:fibronectin type III and SPRY domain-containing protein 2 isoform X1 [Myxocyprinus asiaticus]|uniref:fibronectin type III and SPRY domain-containing protein 2 isoform X1 n=2 Tax=Myxocyprinus asiaticus TaxID=70543 RepID=UPI00222152EA|nr:fibronectin type III and SPRY domain-containing protein 2 isoform X1 [Myxocyprinus asiaticus]XP_051579917.1 fibronectin type III and SPRY domain-containing protein 2 isoform X1 [Myxocyprinus asiaticus]
MDLYEVRGHLDVITEEMTLSEDDEKASDEDAFVLVQETHTSDVFCDQCNTLTHKSAAAHAQHRTITLDVAAQQIKDELSKCSSKLSEKIVEMENFASNLEEIFITVEENFGRQEQNLEQHYNEVLQTLSQRHDKLAAELDEQKKQKLELLYGELLDCGQTLETSKELIERAQKVHRSQDKRAFLQAVMPIIKRVEQFAKKEVNVKLGVSLDFDAPTADLTEVKQMMNSINVLPAPSAPVMNPQMVNSATDSSLRVCWSLFSDDTVEFYELHWRLISDDCSLETTQEVCQLKVKETHCTVCDLLPNAQYELWVTATNTTGISPSSERAVYMTVPFPPVIKPRECVNSLDMALIRWESGNTNPVESYTLEFQETNTDRNCITTESIVAIPSCECLVQLQPWKQYVIHVRAVNIGGQSARSESINIATTGTYFHLLEETAHPSLSLSADGLTMFYLDEDLPLSHMTFSDNTFARCVAVLGDLVPVRGQYYWEIEVDETTEFRIGVAYEDTQRNSYLGGNNTSWCMRHILTPSRHKYEFLHNGWTPDIRITVPPLRIGVFLDCARGILSFYNAALQQHLYTFTCHFLHNLHPCFALDNPGAMTLCTGTPTPAYITQH